MTDFDGPRQLERAAERRARPFERRRPRREGGGRRPRIPIVGPGGRPATAQISEDGTTAVIRIRGSKVAVLLPCRWREPEPIVVPVTAEELLAAEEAFVRAQAEADRARQERNDLVVRAHGQGWSLARIALAIRRNKSRVGQIVGARRPSSRGLDGA